MKDGVARHRAVATMEAVKGPDTPMLVTSSARLGVSRNGTGRLPSNSPEREVGKNVILVSVIHLQLSAVSQAAIPLNKEFKAHIDRSSERTETTHTPHTGTLKSHNPSAYIPCLVGAR